MKMIDIRWLKYLLKSIVIIFVMAFTQAASSTVIGGIDSGFLTEDLDQNTNGFLETGGALSIVSAVAGDTGFIAKVVLNENREFIFDADGNWRYSANNNLAKIQSLAAGEALTEVFVVSSTDGATHDVVITITGSNDTAVIIGDSSGSVEEDTGLLSGYVITTNGKLTITDVDTGESAFVYSRIMGEYGLLFINDRGDWAYYADNNRSYIQSLSAGETLTDVLTVRSTDGTTHEIVITITGANDAAVITGVNRGTVIEDTDLLQGYLIRTIGKLIITDMDTGESIFTFSRIIGTYGLLFINDRGDWAYYTDNNRADIQSLSAGETLTDVLTVRSTDGTAHEVVITITGANDAAVITGDSRGSVIEDTGLLFGVFLQTDGKLDVIDNDTGESSFVIAHSKGDYGQLVIDDVGDWTYYADNNQAAIQSLSAGKALMDVLSVRSTDGTAHEVVITITGANDAAVITGDSRGSVIEDTGLLFGVFLQTDGKLDVIDNDTSESSFVIAHSKGDYGQLVIDDVGDWTYYADNNQDAIQSLTAGEVLTEVLSINSADGTTHEIVITIYGSEKVVDISWQSPILREDESSLTLPEIAGYKIYYGSVPGQYDNSIDINGSTSTSYTFTNLDSNIVYYFVMTCIDTEGRESTYSTEYVIP